MATNPRFPQNRRDDHAHMDLIKGGRGKGWWPIVIIVVAAAILIALIVWLPRAPKRAPAPAAAEVPSQPTANQVRLSDLAFTTPTPAGATNITGTVFNNGNTAITSILAQATFNNINGNNLQTVTAPFLQLNADGTTQPFLNSPIIPGERRAFEMRINRVPEGWNRNLPAIKLVEVGATPTNQSVPAPQKAGE
jgi:hypothetical protein